MPTTENKKNGIWLELDHAHSDSQTEEHPLPWEEIEKILKQHPDLNQSVRATIRSILINEIEGANIFIELLEKNLEKADKILKAISSFFQHLESIVKLTETKMVLSEWRKSQETLIIEAIVTFIASVAHLQKESCALLFTTVSLQLPVKSPINQIKNTLTSLWSPTNGIPSLFAQYDPYPKVLNKNLVLLDNNRDYILVPIILSVFDLDQYLSLLLQFWQSCAMISESNIVPLNSTDKALRVFKVSDLVHLLVRSESTPEGEARINLRGISTLNGISMRIDAESTESYAFDVCSTDFWEFIRIAKRYQSIPHQKIDAYLHYVLQEHRENLELLVSILELKPGKIAIGNIIGIIASALMNIGVDLGIRSPTNVAHHQKQVLTSFPFDFKTVAEDIAQALKNIASFGDSANLQSD